MKMDNLEALRVLMYPDRYPDKVLRTEAAFTIRRLIEKDKASQAQKENK